ncbi:MRN complex-interacting protein [Genypterus blacodes]|uniref:MRN complex-interacting protein n=1 Tax=Genypterus blacodes TaxID=154954 RepID=UPI003F75DD4C
MVQEFHVLRCFSCHTFQVQQVKKVKRWSCKLCGHKQSLLKEFGRGSGADCRRHVQKLNATRGSMLEEQEQTAWSLWEQKSEASVKEDEAEWKEVDEVGSTQVSRWTKYLATPQEEESEEEEEPERNFLMDRQQLHSNYSRDRKRKRRGGWTNGGGGGGGVWTSEQPPEGGSKPQRNPAATGSTSVHKAAQPSLRNAAPSSLRNAAPSSLRNAAPSSLRNAAPSSLRNAGPSSLSCPSSVSRWTRFLNTENQATEEEEEEICVNGWSPSVGGASPVTINRVQEAAVILCGPDEGPAHQTTAPKGHKAVTKQVPSLEQTRPFLSAGSMFDTGEDFSFDGIF